MPGADERIDPELLIGHYANHSSEQAKLEEELKAKLEGLVHRKEAEAPDPWPLVRELRDALKDACDMYLSSNAQTYYTDILARATAALERREGEGRG